MICLHLAYAAFYVLFLSVFKNTGWGGASPALAPTRVEAPRWSPPPPTSASYGRGGLRRPVSPPLPVSGTRRPCHEIPPGCHANLHTPSVAVLSSQRQVASSVVVHHRSTSSVIQRRRPALLSVVDRHQRLRPASSSVVDRRATLCV